MVDSTDLMTFERYTSNLIVIKIVVSEAVALPCIPIKSRFPHEEKFALRMWVGHKQQQESNQRTLCDM